MTDEGSLEPEYMRKEPMAMSSVWWMFNACRIPARPEDYPVKYSYKDHPYIIVVRKNNFYKIAHEIDGKQLTTAELEQQFRRIYEKGEKGPAIGAMTTERRENWAEVGGMKNTKRTLLTCSDANRPPRSQSCQQDSARSHRGLLLRSLPR